MVLRPVKLSLDFMIIHTGADPGLGLLPQNFIKRERTVHVHMHANAPHSILTNKVVFSKNKWM